MRKTLTIGMIFLLVIPVFSVSLTKIYAADYPHDPRGEITNIVIYPSLPSYQGETPEIWVEFHNPTATTYHYLVAVNIFDPIDPDPVYDSHDVGEDIDGYVSGGDTVAWGPWKYTLPYNAEVGTWHILAGLRLYPWEPELDYMGLSWCEPEETFTVKPSHETIEGASADPYDYDGDGYPDSVIIQVLAGTNALEEVDVEAYGDLEDPDGNIVDNEGSGLWAVPAGGQSWGYPFYLFVPGGSPVGTYTVDLYLYDESHRNNYPDPEDVVLGAISIGPLYPPGYDPYQPLHFESDEDTGATVELGSIILDGTPFSLPTDLSAEVGGHTVEYSPDSGYLFDHWETTGGISVSNQNDNPTTMNVNVPGGILRAVYTAELYWQFIAPYSLGGHDDGGAIGGTGERYFDNSSDIDMSSGKMELYSWSWAVNPEIVDFPVAYASAWAKGKLGCEFSAPLDGIYEITLHFRVKGELKAEGLPPITWPVASLWLRGYVIRAGEEVWKEEIWQRGVFGHWLIDESISGTFTVSLQTDNYHIYGFAWSRSMVWADWWPGEALSEFRGSGGVWLEQIEIRLVSSPSETGSLTVSVYDSRGAPVSVPDLNTMVIFQDTTGNIYEIINTPTITTNSYTWNALPAGHSYLVEAYVNDMYSGSSGWIAIESPGVSKSVSITTNDSGFFKVKATLSDGITPLSGAYVEVSSHEGTIWRSGNTDSNGETTWFNLQPTTLSGESYQIYVFYDGAQVGASEGVTLSSSEWTVHHMTTMIIPADVNRDGIVDVLDLNALVEAYGSTSTSPNWNPNADINNDGIVDIFDLRITSAHWGQTW